MIRTLLLIPLVALLPMVPANDNPFWWQSNQPGKYSNLADVQDARAEKMLILAEGGFICSKWSLQEGDCIKWSLPTPPSDSATAGTDQR
jgi:hypothetical protein